MEAMACGIPVVCTKLPHLIGMIKDVRITVPAKNVNTMVNAVSGIYTNPNRAK